MWQARTCRSERSSLRKPVHRLEKFNRFLAWQARQMPNVPHEGHTEVMLISLWCHLPRQILFTLIIYSCYEKGCPVKANTTIPKSIMNSGHSPLLDQSSRCLITKEGEIMTFLSVLLKHQELWSNRPGVANFTDNTFRRCHHCYKKIKLSDDVSSPQPWKGICSERIAFFTVVSFAL